MKAVDPKSSFDYIPECDRNAPATEQTVFELKALTPREDRLLDNMLSMSDGSMNLKVGDSAHLALCMGLVGVRNFFDGSGNEVKVKYTGRKLHGFVNELDEDFLSVIPKDVRLELSRIIQNGADVTEDEVKNS